MIIDPKSLSEDLRRYHAQRRQVPNLGQTGPQGQPSSLPRQQFRTQSPIQMDNDTSNSLVKQFNNIGEAYSFKPSFEPSDLLEQAESIMVKAGKVNNKINRRLSNPKINRIPVTYDVPVNMPYAVPAQNVDITSQSSNKMPKMNPKQMSRYEKAIVAGASHKKALKAAGVQPVNETGGPAPVARSNTAAPSGNFGAFVKAIAGKESGGSYSARNPTSGAMGKYQIMPGNIEGPGGWDMEILGRNVTTQQFMSSPQIQDAIALGKLKKYFNAYGPRGAASAWYSGDPNKWRNTASQGGYPTIAAYVADIIRRMGGRG